MEELASIINKPLTSVEVKRALSRFNLIDRVFKPLEEGMSTERFLTDKAGGVQIEIQPDGRIGTVFLHSFGKDGFGQFQYPLVGGLTFSSTLADVLKCLGSPSARAALDSPSFGVTSWAKYETPLHATHFSFGAGGITLVTILPAEWQPGGRVDG
ncbi:hypothetical protein ACF3M1_15320 [Luteimonas sp. WGS1318]|uniref:hypothetical protein n=1 Tax=Luteimonas sp. WGS1318 TaxID=3366815 RepID=UPI00372D7758